MSNQKEKWILLSSKPELLQVKGKGKIVVSRNDGPMDLVEDKKFNKLYQEGKLQRVVVEVEEESEDQDHELEDQSQQENVEVETEGESSEEVKKNKDLNNDLEDKEDSEDKEKKSDELNTKEDKSGDISKLELDGRIESALKNTGVVKVETLRSMDDEEILDLNGIGEGFLEEIREALSDS